MKIVGAVSSWWLDCLGLILLASSGNDIEFGLFSHYLNPQLLDSQGKIYDSLISEISFKIVSFMVELMRTSQTKKYWNLDQN